MRFDKRGVAVGPHSGIWKLSCTLAQKSKTLCPGVSNWDQKL